MLRVGFLRSDKPREGLVSSAFIEGVKKRGDVGSIEFIKDEDEFVGGFDVVAMIGVKSKHLFDKYRQAGVKC